MEAGGEGRIKKKMIDNRRKGKIFKNKAKIEGISGNMEMGVVNDGSKMSRKKGEIINGDHILKGGGNIRQH